MAQFGLSITRYWQRVNRLLDTEEALAYNPVLVNRLRRLRTPRSCVVRTYDTGT